MAKRRKGRSLDGVLLLDKPQGMTSNQALQKVRWLFNAQKAGHTGSLDPLATGVLPICFGEATKFSRYLLDADKGYYTTATLGDIRTTGDSDGELVETRPVPEIDQQHLLDFLERFKGDIQQVPSMFSALKHQGRPLYEYARKGIVIDRPARPVSIYRLDLQEIRTNLDISAHDSSLNSSELDMAVECSKGTYIRSLVEDIGTELGCGAHVSMLRRFKAGHFELENTVSIETLISLVDREHESPDFSKIDEFLLPTDSLLPNNRKVCLKSELISSILHGQAVRIADFENPGLVSVYVTKSALEALVPNSDIAIQATKLDLSNAEGSSSNKDSSNKDPSFKGTASEEQVFIGVAEITEDGMLQPKRLIAF